MSAVPLDQLEWRWRDHKAALWWLGLLYRRPAQFRQAVAELSWTRGIFAAIVLWAHFLPYLILICMLGRLFVFSLLGLPPEEPLGGPWDLLYFHAMRIAVGIARGISVGIVVGIAGGIVAGIVAGISVGIVVGIAFGVAGGIVAGIGVGIGSGIGGGIGAGIAVGIARGIVVGIGSGIGGGIGGGIGAGIAVGIAGGVAVGMGGGIGAGIAFGIGILRLYYYPFHVIVVWPRIRPAWYPYHPVAWDDLCPVPFFKLDHLLIAHAEQTSEHGIAEIERLIDGYPSQRTAALRARVRFLARASARLPDLAMLNALMAQLPEGERGFLSQTPRVREMVREIAELQIGLDTMDRPIFREPRARHLCTEIENFQHRIGGFHEPLASEFRAAASYWLQIAQRQLQEATAVLVREPTPQVFRAGDPVDRDKEAFVPRSSVVGELERQIMLSTGCPGIVLYGRRRMGKSTILRNLSGFLPPTVRPIVLSMQHPGLFRSTESLVRSIRHEIRRAFPAVEALGKISSDLAGLFRFLSKCNAGLEVEDKRLLLAVDEYENIDQKIAQGIFAEDLLATVRESIQSHRRLTWIFAGSHEISELPHAAWTSCLVSARTVEVPLFTLAETRLLLTEPLKHSSLWAKDAPERPHMAPEFWGDGGIERIHREAGGWPHLVQLIAETTIDLLNDGDTRQVDASLLERALDKSVALGHNVMYELMRRESTMPGEWEYLSAFRTQTTQPPPNDEIVQRSLRRRLLVVEENGDWRLRVPLMARWLRERG